MGHLLGYARVSTDDQNLDLQVDALTKAGCYRIFPDKVSGAKTDRPELARLLDQIRPGDTLVVWRLDRLGRSLPHLVSTVNELADRGVKFASLTEGFDTGTPGGELVFHIFAALAQFERRLIQERTRAGLAAARARGRVGGRRRKLTELQARMAREMYDSRKHTVADIARTFGVTRPTIYRELGMSNNSSTPVVG
jgi:DNA invertase Pin-like site-specific DNA recombinase